MTVTYVPDPQKADGAPVTAGGSQSAAPKQIFGPSDGPVVGNIPQVTPTTSEAIYIGSDGQQYQWFGGSWH